MSILSAANPQSSALLTDLYQLTMLQGYFDQRMEETAVFEFFVRKLPRTRNFLLAAGLEQALAFLETVRFTPRSWVGSGSSRSTGELSRRIRRHGNGLGGASLRCAGLRHYGSFVRSGAR